MGKRVGTKRSDRRWEDENGVWASKLESRIFAQLIELPGITVRRCTPEQGDTFDYHTAVRGGKCGRCGAGDVVQQRTYTPDFYITGQAGLGEARGFYVEAKGHFPGERRSLLRAFLKTGPSIDLRLVLQRDGRATSGLNMTEYWAKYAPELKVHVWDGTLPRSWYESV